jgi:anti-anti-sigma factor
MDHYPLMMSLVPNHAGEGPSAPLLMDHLSTPGASGRRIEEWIVSNLEGSPCPMLPGLQPDASGGRSKARLRRGLSRAGGRELDEGWRRVRVSESGGIVVVLLVDRSIVEDANIREIGRALRDLIAAGSHHIVVDFGLVERCSSRVLALLAELAERCREAGGRLKLCGLRIELDDLFTVLGLKHVLPVFPDEASAVASPWPARPPTSLPVSILSALRARAGQAPGHLEQGGGGDPMSSSRLRDDRRADPPAETSNPTEDLVARWLLEDRDGDADINDSAEPAPAPEEAPLFGGDSAYDEATGEGGLKCEVIQGVLVVTVLMPALADASAVGLLRDALVGLMEGTPHRRVVVSLCNVGFLSSAAVGVLVSHMLQLEWAGGGLRLCHILPPVMAVLKKIHLPRLVGTYPTLDEAVLAAWK